MGPLRSGPKGGADGVGQYKTPSMRDSICALRGRARSALFNRVQIIFLMETYLWTRTIYPDLYNQGSILQENIGGAK